MRLPVSRKLSTWKNHRNRFENEDAAHDREEQFLFAANRDDADDAADRERAGVAHDDFRGMAIEPKKPQAGPDERGADDRQLAGVGIERDLEIFRDAKISRGVGKQRVSKRDRDRAANGEAVEAVGEIHRVR